MNDQDMETKKSDERVNHMRAPSMRSHTSGDADLHTTDPLQQKPSRNAIREISLELDSPGDTESVSGESELRNREDVSLDQETDVRLSQMGNHKGKKRDAEKKSRVLSSFLLVLAFACLALGIYLLVKPAIVHKNQDKIADNLLEQLNQLAPSSTEEVSIEVNVDDINLPGSYSDEYDYILPPGVTIGETVDVKPTVNTPKPGTIITIRSDSIMRISKINLEIAVAPDINASSLWVLPGHYPSSVQPGEVGINAYFGHRMYGKGRHFNRLDEVTPGDTIKIQRKGMLYTYVVDSSDIIEPSELGRFIYERTDEPRIVLVTCHPKQMTGVPKYRIVVRGHLESAQPIG
ncbi:MAG: sortase [Clostridiaceae bacterium]|nr:sortase [Clostridiaceae bacterium]